MSHQDSIPRAIEVGFPIVEINRLAVPERNSFKPIYQMHKWFARRASCVFRAILLGSLKPAFRPDGSPVDIMEEFYKDHTDDPDTKGMTVLDPFMGGGTTVVEALRGVQVSADDLKRAGLIIKGRTGRGRFFKVKQPEERLGALKERLEPASRPGQTQFTLFDESNRPIEHAVDLVDVVHLLIGLAWAGESVVPWLERYAGLRPKLKAALSFVRDHRKDWKDYIDRILNLVEGKPLLRGAGEGSPQSNSE